MKPEKPPSDQRPSAATLLEIDDLTVTFPTRAGEFNAVDGMTLRLDRGETVAILGESGSGKTMTGLAIMRLIPGNGRIARGTIRFGGDDLLKMSEKEIRAIRGRRIAMIFQDPLSSMNPVLTVGSQIEEMFRVHKSGLSHRQMRERAIDLLRQVRIPDPETRLDDYPHQLSGGMRQRATIAMALALDPDVLIADEPTTALDVTVQGQILDLLNQVKERRGMGLVLITHDFGVVAKATQRLIVMYAGRAVETGDIESVYESPAHPYTQGLMGAVPKLKKLADRLTPIPGLPAKLQALPTGCAFHPRCSYAEDVCVSDIPPLLPLGSGRASACHFAREVKAGTKERGEVARSRVARSEVSDAASP